MINVRLADDHLYGKLLFTWLSLVNPAGIWCQNDVDTTSFLRHVPAGEVFDGVFLCCSFFPRDVLDEIWDLIESDSEGFPTYFRMKT